MGETVPIDAGRRLKGLDEFVQPPFVGRMARVERRRKAIWRAMIILAGSVGAVVGLLIG